MILITRPQPDADSLANDLRRQGHQVLVDPLLTIFYEPKPEIPIERLQALVFTSANGIRAFAQHFTQRQVPVFTVGEATEQAAREVGLKKVEAAAGTVEDLYRLLQTRLNPNQGPIIHGAGREVKGDLTERLCEKGFDAQRITLYRAEAAEDFRPETHQALKQKQISQVWFYSPRTAQIFMNLLEKKQKLSLCQDLKAVCLSQAIAESLDHNLWGEVDILSPSA